MTADNVPSRNKPNEDANSGVKKGASHDDPAKARSDRWLWMRTAAAVIFIIGGLGSVASLLIGLVLWNQPPTAGYLLGGLAIATAAALEGLRATLAKSSSERGELVHTLVPFMWGFAAVTVPWAGIVLLWGFQGWLIAVGGVIVLVILDALGPKFIWVKRTYRIHGNERTLIAEVGVPDPDPMPEGALQGLRMLVVGAGGWTLVTLVAWFFVDVRGIWG